MKTLFILAGLLLHFVCLSQAQASDVGKRFLPPQDPAQDSHALAIQRAPLIYDQRKRSYYFETQLNEAQCYPTSIVRDDGTAFSCSLLDQKRTSILIAEAPSEFPAVFGGALLAGLVYTKYEIKYAALAGIVGYLGISHCARLGKNPSFETEKLLTLQDRRRPVGDEQVSTWPWRVHGHLKLTFSYPGETRTYIGSGTLVGDSHVLTAGHNLYDHYTKQPVRSVEFYPGQSGTNVPWRATGVNFLIHPQYKLARTQNEQFESDMGMVILDRPLGKKLGFFGLRTLADTEKPNVTIAGYPGEPGNGEYMYQMSGPIKQHRTNMTDYDVDTTGGQSGSGVWTAEEECVAVHTCGSSPLNSGTRLHKIHTSLIKGWLDG